MKIISIASGSSGNSTYLETDGTHILIDCGISASAVIREMEKFAVDPKDLDGIFISHEHHDHIDGAFTLSRKLAIPLYMNPGTYDAANHKINGSKVLHFTTGETMPLGNVDIHFFPISHDTFDPVGFKIHSCEGEIIHATDLGILNGNLDEIFDSARVILMDFNHDLEMLIKGPYPIFLKERIAGNKGHLSNESAAKFLAGLDLPNLETLILGHLSRTNNIPTIARSTALSAFTDRKRLPKIVAADQYRPRLLELSANISNN